MTLDHLAFSLAIVCLGSCARSPVVSNLPRNETQAVPKEPSGSAPLRLEELLRLRRLGGASFSHDEKLLAFQTNVSGRPEIWVKPVAGGRASQLTHLNGELHSFAFSPVDDLLLYAADEGGNDLPRLYLTNASGRAPEELGTASSAGARAQLVGWARDGRTFLYLSNARDRKYMDLCEYQLESRSSEVVWQAEGSLTFAIASGDHRRFLVTSKNSARDSSVYLVERGKQGAVLLTPHGQEDRFEPQALSEDGASAYMTSNDGREFAALLRLDLASKAFRTILQPEWDVETARFSAKERYFYTVVNADGAPLVKLSEVASGRSISLPRVVPDGVLVPTAFSPTERFLATSLVSDAHPSALFVVDLKDGSYAPVDDAIPQALQSREWVAGASVRIPSFDGRSVPAFLYRPAGPGPFPAVIDLHGGPTYQSRRRFDSWRQYLVSKGYLVLVPNVRGSTGYGKTYTALDDLDLGGGPLQDVVSCKRWLVREASVDPERVAIMGGSYGGYMALAAATFTPTEFAAHIDYCGASDLKSYTERIPTYWAAETAPIFRKLGNPHDPAHAQYQHDRSPANFPERVVRPLLIVQGENDTNTRKELTDRLVARLREHQVPLEYIVLPGEGHNITRRENVLRIFQATDEFLSRFLRPAKSKAAVVPGGS